MANLISRLRGGLKKTLFATVVGLSLFSCPNPLEEDSQESKPESPIELPVYPGPKTKIAFTVQKEYGLENDQALGRSVKLYFINSDNSDFKEASGFGQVDPGRVRVSPDGEYFVSKEDSFWTEKGRHSIINLEGERLHEFKSISARDRSEEDFIWTPDGKSILYGVYMKGIYQYDLSKKITNEIIQSEPLTYDHNPVMSPNLEKIIYTHHEYENHYYIYTINSDGTGKELITNGTGTYYDEQLNLTWLDNQNFIWKMKGNGKIYHSNLNTKKVNEINPQFGFGDIELSPDKKTLAMYGVNQIGLVDVNELLSGSFNVKKINCEGNNFEWSPDGNYFMRIKMNEKRIGRWQAELKIYDKEGNQYKSLTREDFPICPHGDSFRDIAWSSKVLQ
jgi:hypothetical protein